MTNTEMLKSAIDRKGLKQGYVAERLGITRQGFLKKLNNESEFKANEIQILHDLLGLSKSERDNIFFGVSVDKISITKERG